MIGEIGSCLRRAEASEIIRRTDHDHAAGAELARDQARGAQGPDTDGDVGPLLYQVDQRIGQHQVELDVGMLRHETRDQRHHMQHAEGDVAVDEAQPRDLGAVGWTLSADQIRRLDEVSAVKPAYPYYPYRIQEGFARLNPPLV